MRPKPANIAANIPAFLSKLWKIVNDPDTDHLISWSSDGHSFIIQNQAQFWYNLLPIYYKHNNMSSFIRQLNMYGFHKISSESGGVECDRDELKFYHPFFQQDQPTLMKLIKRKMASTKTTTATTNNPEDKVTNVDQISKVLVDVKQLRGRQESVDNQLASMKQENAALWQELALLRQKHMKQQQIVNKLIHFLVHIVNPNRAGPLGGLGVKRRYPLMINDSRYTKSPKTTKTTTDTSGPTIHELETDAAAAATDITSPPPPIIDENLLDIPNSSDLLLSGEEDCLEKNAEKLLKPGTSTDLGDFPLKATDLQGVMAAANEYIDINDFETSSSGDEEMLDDVEHITNKTSSPVKHILNPNMRDAIISNFVTGMKSSPTVELPPPVVKDDDESSRKIIDSTKHESSNLKLNSVNGVFRDDLDSHLESTQGELDSIKDILFDGYSLDANALLGNQNQSNNNRFDGIPFQLFNQNGDLPTLDDKNLNNEASNYDPMMSGSELMSYTNHPFVLDFDNLLEEPDDDRTLNECGNNDDVDDTSNIGLVNLNDDQSHLTLTTPIVIKKEPPTFPTVTTK